MSVSIDKLFIILGSTVFSPFLCWYPFLIRSAIQLGYDALDSGGSSENDIITSYIKSAVTWSNYWYCYLAFALLVTCFWDVLILDKWIYMRKSRQRHQVSKDVDAVVITGAGTKDGVGRNVARWFQKRGFQVFALDIVWEDDLQPSEAELIPIEYIKCDVREYTEVKKVYESIAAKLPASHVPSVLINAAGITHNKTLVELDPEVIKKTIDVNLLGTMWTCKCLLEYLSNKSKPFGVSITNVSSVLGVVGPAQLSAYSASKAGVRLFHDALTHEIGEPYYSQANGSMIRRKFPANTLLIISGQLSTQMFKGVSTPSNFFAPVLTPEYVANEIGQAIMRSQTGTLHLPLYTQFSYFIWMLPGFLIEWVRSIAKIDEKMDTWKGPKQS